MSLNKVMLMGNLGADPEVRFTAQQLPVCSFNIATNDRRKNSAGEWEDHTEWHKISTFGRTAENCGKFLAKGRTVFVEGRLRTSKYQDKEGHDRYRTEILADNVQFVGGRGESRDSAMGDYGSSNSSGAGGNYSSSSSSSPSSTSTKTVSFEDDDIPF